MRMKDCEIVLAVAELKSFTKAGERLHLSQPAISLAIRRFEESYGDKIFERNGNQVALAPSANQALWAVQRIHDIFATVLQKGAVEQRIRIGLPALLSGINATSLMENLRRLGRHNVELEFLASDDAFHRDDLDLSVFLQSGTTSGDTEVGLRAHWIGARNGVVIYSKQERSFWDQALRRARVTGIKINRLVEVNSCSHAYELAADGVGMTPCVMSAASRYHGNIIQDLPDLPLVKFGILSSDRPVAALMKRILAGSPSLAIAV